MLPDWHPYECTCERCVDRNDDIPEALRRDRTTNKAPWQDMPTYGGSLVQHTVQSRAFTPEANPPAKSQEWLPPWGSKS
jgi:hypothetical protein